MSTAQAEFYGVISRRFVIDAMGDLSRVASRVYAYLRTWCFGDVGQAGAWRQLRVAKIAADLGWTTRYIRRGLAELRDAKLLERREQFRTLDDGTRAQDANLWRVLPCEGETTMPEKRTKGSQTRGGKGRVADGQILSAAIRYGLDQLDGMLTDAQHEAHDGLREARATLSSLQDPDDDWGRIFGPDQLKLRIAEQAEHVESWKERLERFQRLSGLPHAQVIDTDEDVRVTVIDLVAKACIRSAIAQGKRQRSAQRTYHPDLIERELRDHLRKASAEKEDPTPAA